jgi:hypothetical protein
MHYEFVEEEYVRSIDLWRWYINNHHSSGHYPSSRPLFKTQTKSIGLSVSHRKHMSPLRARSGDMWRWYVNITITVLWICVTRFLSFQIRHRNSINYVINLFFFFSEWKRQSAPCYSTRLAVSNWNKRKPTSPSLTRWVATNIWRTISPPLPGSGQYGSFKFRPEDSELLKFPSNTVQYSTNLGWSHALRVALNLQ